MKPIATLTSCAVLVAAATAAWTRAAADDPKTKKKGEKPKTVKKGKEKTEPKKEAALPFKSLKENASYAIGLNAGNQVMARLMQQLAFVELDRKQLAKAMKINKKAIESIEDDGIPLDHKLLHEGFSDAVTGAKPKMTALQMRGVFRETEKLAVAARKMKIEKVKKEGDAFLAKNKKKEGIVTTKSGLQYEVIKKGTGKSPTAADTVTVHYEGKLRSGKVFDSSKKRGIPATFPVGGVIKGWTEALQLMKVGSKWRLYIPSDLGYRERGSRDGSIGPNEVLIFEVELIDVKSAPNPPKKK